jgi:acetolactate synthase regulatory subunit
MKEGTYKISLEIEVLKELKPETLENFFRTVLNRSGSLMFLNMSKPVLADSDQAALEMIIAEGIRKAALEDSFLRVVERSGGVNMPEVSDK